MNTVKEPKKVTNARNTLKTLEKKSLSDMTINDLEKAQVAKEVVMQWEENGKVVSDLTNKAEEVKKDFKKIGMKFTYAISKTGKRGRKPKSEKASAETTSRRRGVKKETLKFLEKADEAVSASEVADALHYDGNMGALLNNYAKSGEVKKVGKGRGCKYEVAA